MTRGITAGLFISGFVVVGVVFAVLGVSLATAMVASGVGLGLSVVLLVHTKNH